MNREPKSALNLKLQRIHDVLTNFHGLPERPITRDPFELILWEQVAYLAPDEQRAQAFDLLKTKVGLTPERILSASDEDLLEITRAGGSIAAPKRAARLKRSAEMAITEWSGDLRKILELPLSTARKALTKFPMIGEPGAEKILLFTGTYPVLSLDSNGLRVLLRLGYGQEEKDYRRTYRSVQQATLPELRRATSWLTQTFQLLRRHGREICKRSTPKCEVCPLAEMCAYYRSGIRDNG